MNAISAKLMQADRPEVAAQALAAGLVVFAAYHLGLAVFMAVGPHAFYKAVGPFGAFNSHYIRDTATFNAALGLGFGCAVSRPAWRVPVLAVTSAQFALHTLNHLLDIGRAHPAWTGYFDFFSLLAATLLLAWLLALALAQARGGAPGPLADRIAVPSTPDPSPSRQRRPA